MATAIMKDNPILPMIDSKTPTQNAILRYNGGTNKWEAYEFSRFSYRITSILNISSTLKKILSKEAYAQTTHYESGPIIIGNNIVFKSLNSGGTGEIIINPSCRYKITLNATMYINDITNNNNQADLDLIIYGYDANGSKEVVLGNCTTFLYTDGRHITMSIIAFVDNIGKNQSVAQIVSKIRLRRPTAVTYIASPGPDTTINIAVEEY